MKYFVNMGSYLDIYLRKYPLFMGILLPYGFLL